MRWTGVVIVLVMLTGRGLSQVPSSESDAATRAADERCLRDKGIAADGAGLLKFFRERTLSPAQQEQLADTVRLLGASSYRQRMQAAAELVKAGELAKPFLQDILKDSRSDLEVIRRAELCLRQLTEGHEAVLAGAAARLVARQKPAGAAQTLLAYLPFATDPQVIEEIQDALAAVARRDGRPDPILVKALSDTRSNKRALAGVALCRVSGKMPPAVVRDLLKDPVPEVRLKIALALVEAQDKSGIPVLIALLVELPEGDLWRAQEMLHRLAGENGPSLYVDHQTPAAKVRAAWTAWWNKNQDGVDLAKLAEAPQLLGYTLVTQMDKGTTGRVYELRPNKEVHWQIDGVRYPVDAHVVGRDRVLIAEYLNNRVSERDFKGNVKWEKQVSLPIACQRLANGDTFIASRRTLMVVDKSGRETFVYNHASTSISAAQRLRDGQMILITSGGIFQRLDANGKVVKTFNVGQVYTLGGNIDVLPNGRVLVPQYRDNRVVEYDQEGTVRWQANVNFPTSAVRLPNGNTLVVSMSQQRVVELNRDGKEVWSMQTDGRPWRARRR